LPPTMPTLRLDFYQRFAQESGWALGGPGSRN
jgi:hypothetical protein